MSVVVSDTSPLHYLVLCEATSILPVLFDSVLLPPAVWVELQHPHAPVAMRAWSKDLPPWVTVRAPSSVDSTLDVDEGEREAICLAREIGATAIPMDDRKGRLAAARCGLRVTGTLGLLEAAAARGLLNLPEVLSRLAGTNARLDQDLVREILARAAGRGIPRDPGQPR